MSDAGEIVLYDHAASPCARRVRIALIEKGVRWRSRPIDLEHMEQKSAWYLALNPNGIVPTLQHLNRLDIDPTRPPTPLLTIPVLALAGSAIAVAVVVVLAALYAQRSADRADVSEVLRLGS